MLEEINVEPPGPGEVLVRILASGVCHTDLLYKSGTVGNDFPYLLGHEGSGIIEAVGEGVAKPEVGDYVVLAWRAPCERCRFCQIGQPNLCSASLNAKPRMSTKQGNVVLAWRAPCERCRFCQIGQPNLCSASLNAPHVDQTRQRRVEPGPWHFAPTPWSRPSKQYLFHRSVRHPKPVSSAVG